MDPQKIESPHHEKLLIGIVVGLLLGGAGGYYAGWLLGEQDGMAKANDAIQQQTPTVEASAQTNPLEDVQTNPLGNVKVNPFE
jgi:hypothetical protein